MQIPGQLVIVDEVSMASTVAFHRITTEARAAGAKILPVGAPHQPSPVQAGGAFALLVSDRGDAPLKAPWVCRIPLHHDAVSEPVKLGKGVLRWPAQVERV